MDRTRVTGALLMGAAALQFLLFLAALGRRSYAALAVPITLVVGALSALAFWIGWTLAAMEDELEGLEFEAEPLDED